MSAIRLERIVFLILCLVILFPLFLPGFFMTLDGPSHLYNARLFFDLLRGNSAVNEIFTLNTANFTNLTGHFVVGLLNLALPAMLAEKIFIGMLVISLAYSFRFLVKSLKPDRMILSWLILPLLWSSLLFHGFFNFLIGIVFLLLALRFWFTSTQSKMWKKVLWMLLLLTFAALSHVLSFVLALGICFAWEAWNALFYQRELKQSSSQGIRKFLKSVGLLFLSALPGVVIFSLFISSGSYEATPGSKPGLMAVLNEIRIFKSAIALVDGEQAFSAKWFYWLMLMSVAVFWIRRVLRSRDRIRENAAAKRFRYLRRNDFFLFISLGLMVLFVFETFFVKQQYYLHDRLIYLAFIMIVLWIALQSFPSWFSGTSVVVALLITFGLFGMRLPYMRDSKLFSNDINQLAPIIPSYSRIYVVSFSKNWLNGHTYSYLATDQPLLLLNNYECEQLYFPVRYKPEIQERMGILTIAFHNGDFQPFYDNPPFNYVLTSCEADALDELQYIRFRLMLNRYYVLEAKSDNGLLSLYRLKNTS